MDPTKIGSQIIRQEEGDDCFPTSVVNGVNIITGSRRDERFEEIYETSLERNHIKLPDAGVLIPDQDAAANFLFEEIGLDYRATTEYGNSVQDLIDVLDYGNMAVVTISWGSFIRQIYEYVSLPINDLNPATSPSMQQLVMLYSSLVMTKVGSCFILLTLHIQSVLKMQIK